MAVIDSPRSQRLAAQEAAKKEELRALYEEKLGADIGQLVFALIESMSDLAPDPAAIESAQDELIEQLSQIMVQKEGVELALRVIIMLHVQIFLKVNSLETAHALENIPIAGNLH